MVAASIISYGLKHFYYLNFGTSVIKTSIHLEPENIQRLQSFLGIDNEFIDYLESQLATEISGQNFNLIFKAKNHLHSRLITNVLHAIYAETERKGKVYELDFKDLHLTMHDVISREYQQLASYELALLQDSLRSKALYPELIKAYQHYWNSFVDDLSQAPSFNAFYQQLLQEQPTSLTTGQPELQSLDQVETKQVEAEQKEAQQVPQEQVSPSISHHLQLQTNNHDATDRLAWEFGFDDESIDDDQFIAIQAQVADYATLNGNNDYSDNTGNNNLRHSHQAKEPSDNSFSDSKQSHYKSAQDNLSLDNPLANYNNQITISADGYLDFQSNDLFGDYDALFEPIESTPSIPTKTNLKDIDLFAELATATTSDTMQTTTLATNKEASEINPAQPNSTLHVTASKQQPEQRTATTGFNKQIFTVQELCSHEPKDPQLLSNNPFGPSLTQADFTNQEQLALTPPAPTSNAVQHKQSRSTTNQQSNSASTIGATTKAPSSSATDQMKDATTPKLYPVRSIPELTERQREIQAIANRRNLTLCNGLVKGKSANQDLYLNTIAEQDITFGIGPAGTGKTYLAVAVAVDYLIKNKIKRIIVTRPAVEAGENLGFLPGDISQKLDPYLKPLFDVMQEILGPARVTRLMEQNIIEIAPLAFMRGRTLSDAFIILDEAQNTTVEQMKMFLTRLGFGSKMVITGDVSQIDLPRNKKSGLIHAQEVLTDVDEITFHHFTSSDIVRHPTASKVVARYEAWEAQHPQEDKSKPVHRHRVSLSDLLRNVT